MKKAKFKLSPPKLMFLMILLGITKFGNARMINCNFMNSIWPDEIGKLYVCDVVNKYNLQGGNVTIEKVTGIHKLDQTNEDVQLFQINQAQELTKFPTKVSNFFPKLVSIFVGYSGLTEITKEDLKPFGDLKYFHMPYNKIQFIREDTFENNPKLEVIWLFRNEISQIDRRTFSHLNYLRYLDLENNPSCSSLRRARSELMVQEMVEKIENGICEPTTSPITTITTVNPLITEIENQKQQNDDLKNEIETLKEQNEEQKQQISSCKVKVDEFEDKIDQQRKKLAILTYEKGIEIHKLTTENQQLKNCKKEAKSVIKSELKQNSQTFETKINKLTNEMKSLIEMQKMTEAKMEESAKNIQNIFESNLKLSSITELIMKELKEVNEKL